MPRTILPVVEAEEERTSRGDPGEHDDLFRSLPEDLQSTCQERRYLWEYICMLPADVGASLEYYEKVKRSAADQQPYNLIYRANEDAFVHLVTDPEGGRPHYVPIEPGMTLDLGELLAEFG